jgi:signal peptidase II
MILREMCRRVTTARVVVLAAMFATIGCDHLTKHAATALLADSADRVLFADMVRLTYARNSGAFLGFGAALPPIVRLLLFTIATGAALAALAVLVLRSPRVSSHTIGLSLIVAGGVSNWIDRLVSGSVVDFLNVGVGSWRTGIFNVADASIMMGAVLLVGLSGRRRRNGTE